jgi:hypothetical protein
MARKLIDRYSDYDVESIAPTLFNYSTDANEVVNDVASGEGSFKVYDPSKDEVISVDEAIGQTELNISNVGVFNVGDSVEITQNDGTLLATSVNSVDAVNGTVTFADALTVAADVGNRVRVIFGASIAMTEFGTADLNTRNWGYVGVMESTHAAHSDPRTKTSMDVDIEVKITNGVKISTDVICATISEDDCG